MPPSPRPPPRRGSARRSGDRSTTRSWTLKGQDSCIEWGTWPGLRRLEVAGARLASQEQVFVRWRSSRGTSARQVSRSGGRKTKNQPAVAHLRRAEEWGLHFISAASLWTGTAFKTVALTSLAIHAISQLAQ